MIKLADDITKVKYISESYKTKLNTLGIFKVKDLLTYFPRSYIDSSQISEIEAIKNFSILGNEYTFHGTVESFNNIFLRNGKTLQKIKFTDESGDISITFFNQKFLSRVFKTGKEYLVTAKVTEKNGKINFYPKNYEEIIDGKESVHIGRISPEYKLTAGITKKWFRNRMKWVIDEFKVGNIELDNNTQKIKKLINIEIENLIEEVHFPSEQVSLDESLNNLSLIELCDVHLKIKKQNEGKNSKGNIKVNNLSNLANNFIKKIPFTLTEDQQNIISNLIEKIDSQKIISDLVQGDVGSGKTIIAIFLSYLMAKNGYQAVVLAPTTVLAKQHYENFNDLIGKEVDVDLITSNTSSQEPSQISIGTTAILARKDQIIKEDKLGLIIVDEQHRFGVNQRKELLKLIKKNENLIPHFLEMTATPIPRTIAETFFSDLQVHNILTKPAGRKEIKTFVVPREKRKDSFEWIKKEILDKDQQVYWVCPLVEVSDKIKAVSVEEVYKELCKIYGADEVGLLHGKMKNDEKVKIMKQYSDKKFKVLVSTTVIEVGVDVKDSTVMVIENSERFGLAQLHQIRGRVGRNDLQSYCFLYTNEDSSEEAKERLNFFANEGNGLKIAEYDLERRGPGEVYGTRQAGIPNLKIAKLNNIEMIRKSKNIADQLWKKRVRRVSLFR